MRIGSLVKLRNHDDDVVGIVIDKKCVFAKNKSAYLIRFISGGESWWYKRALEVLCE